MADLFIDYNSEKKEVIFRVSNVSPSAEWFAQIRRCLYDRTQLVRDAGVGEIAAPWWSFLAVRESVGSILYAAGVAYDVSAEAKRLLERASDNQKRFSTVGTATCLSEEEIKQKLISVGWLWSSRSFTKEQMRNVRKLTTLSAGATFSVPGSGKTTEALGYFFLKANVSQHLLVVAPKNTFGSWEEQLDLCVDNKFGNFVRLRGGTDNIVSILSGKPKFMLITYQQLARVTDLIANFLSECETFVYLDESHKIKAGRGKATADAVLTISHLPIGKLILSGTPMPQSEDDLVPQFEYLYPELRVTSQDVVSQIGSVFVRTTKKELNIPSPKRHTIPIPFNSAQKTLYDLMRSEVVREAEKTLSRSSRAALRSLGKSVMRLIEVVSNPVLLAKDIMFLHQDLLSEVLSEGAAPKIRYACERARRLAKEGKKTLIWTTFRDNVESIADSLRDLNAVYIHGGVDAGEEDDNDTREGKIKQFHNDRNCFVLVANPAAAGEGISLHKVCHHAVYVDRTYNAAHYLQSEDRLHRLGLLPDEAPTIEILQCPNSIDENIHIRLEAKIMNMAKILDDQSLYAGANQYIPFDCDEDPECGSEYIDMDDVKSILEWLRGGK